MESNLLYSEFIKEPIKILDVGANEHQEEFLSGLAPYCEIHAVQPFDKDFFKLKKNQNFKGLVALQNEKNPKFIVNGNELKVFYENRFQGNILISVLEGIKNDENYGLKNRF